METLGIAGLVVGGLAAFGALLVKLWGNSQKAQGRLEEQNEQRAKESESKTRANEVLAEHRDPDDATERLRKHDF